MAPTDEHENKKPDPGEEHPELFPLDIRKTQKKVVQPPKPKPVQRSAPAPRPARQNVFQYTPPPPQTPPSPSPAAPSPAPTPAPAKGCCLGKAIKIYVIMAIIGYALQMKLFQEVGERISSWWHNFEQTELTTDEQKYTDFLANKKALIAHHPRLILEMLADSSSKVPEADWVKTDSILILQETEEERKRYVLAPGTLKKFKNRKNKKEKILDYANVYQQEVINQLLEEGANDNTKVVLKDSDNGTPYTVFMRDIYYYNEVKLIFIFNNRKSYDDGQRGAIYIPYQMLQKVSRNSENIDEMTIDDCKPKALFWDRD